jgi:fatty acid desaturase
MSVTRLQLDEVRELSQISHWRSLAQGFIEWGWIGLAIVLAKWIDSIALYPLWVLLIGSRQHALAILMHDAAHGRVHPDRNWNDAIGELMFAWPLLISMRAYRRVHLAHHRHLQTPLDPDWKLWRKFSYYWFPKNRSAVIGEIARFSLGFGAIQIFGMLRHFFKLYVRPQDSRVTNESSAEATASLSRFILPLCGVAVLAGLITAVTWLDAWTTLVLYWVIPLLTATLGIQYVRGLAEHFISENGGPEALSCSRSMSYSLLERILVAPLNVGYHLEHHLYPSVPFYRLKELHHRLMAMPDFRQQAHVTHGVSGVISECATSHSTLALWEKQESEKALPINTEASVGQNN